VNCIYNANALDVLTTLGDESVDLVYTDPPFGTQSRQVMSRRSLGAIVSSVCYDDKHDDYMTFIRPHLVELHRVLKKTGTLYIHLDTRWVHYVKVTLDEIFGREAFLNEVIWAYDFGGRGKRCWPKKHDTILVYVKTPGEHVFNWDDVDKIPYMTPGLQKDAQRAKDGKVPTDVWWMSIVGTNSGERLGYPNQKPLKLVKRAVIASSPMGGIVLDPFAGSGTTGAAAHECGREFVLVDRSLSAIDVMKKRFVDVDVEYNTAFAHDECE